MQASGDRMSTAQHHRTSAAFPTHYHHRLSLAPESFKDGLDTPQLDTDETAALVAVRMQEFNEMATRLKQTVQSNQDAWKIKSADAKDKQARTIAELNTAKSQQAELESVLAKERAEAAELQKTIKDLERRLFETQQARNEISAMYNLAEEDYQSKRQLAQTTQRSIEEQRAKSRPELQCYHSQLALRIVPVKEDHVGFVFTMINERGWNQECSFTVAVDEESYKVVDCIPRLADEIVEELVAILNQTREFYRFVKNMRKAFKEFYRKKN